MNKFKLKIIVLAAIPILILIWNAGLGGGVESRPYVVEEIHDGFEVRKYSTVIMATVSNKGRMMETSNSSFRQLAGYIFGGNQTGVKIAMTSPVVMKHNHSDSMTTMSFMMPSDYTLKTLPAPESDAILFSQEPSYKMAVRKFGGFASDKDIEREAAELRKELSKKKIHFKEPVIYLGYNPPFQLINRRNEVAFILDGY
jgi:hypothetical protein